MTDNNALAQLKPCPFCGGEPKYIPDHTIERNDTIVCLKCVCEIAAFHHGDDFVKVWNTRTPAPASGEVAKLCETLETCAQQSEMGRNFASTPIACRQAADMLERLAGPVQGLAICEHGIRHPWACHQCDDAAWKARPQPVQQAGGDQVGRVARALCVQGGYDPDEIMPNDGPRWRYYEPGARAALAAMQPATTGESG